MHKLLTSLAVLGSGLGLAVACSEDKTGNLFPDLDPSSQAGSAGNADAGGAVGGSTAGGSSGGGGAAGSEPSAGSGGQDAGVVGSECVADTDCDDGDPCTLERCQAGVCAGAGFSPAGSPCGNPTDDACTRPDSCDGAGVCQPNHNTDAAGMPCGSSVDDECTHPDTCDALGVCQPHHELPGTACGDQTVSECRGSDQCDDDGRCSPNNLAVGTACGDDTEDECTHHDVCAAGACLANDEPNGTACTGGSCTQGQCIAGQPVGCPIDVVNSVPANLEWSSVGRPDLFGGGCDEAGTPDYALIFTAPAAGTYRFVVHGLIDSTPYTGADTSTPPTEPPDGDAVITVADGSCAGPGAQQLDCNDDAPQGNGNPDAQLDLSLGDQQVVTVYLNERTQRGGGTGTLSITLLE